MQYFWLDILRVTGSSKINGELILEMPVICTLQEIELIMQTVRLDVQREFTQILVIFLIANFAMEFKILAKFALQDTVWTILRLTFTTVWHVQIQIATCVILIGTALIQVYVIHAKKDMRLMLRLILKIRVM
jgi:hypothetical protein